MNKDAIITATKVETASVVGRPEVAMTFPGTNSIVLSEASMGKFVKSFLPEGVRVTRVFNSYKGFEIEFTSDRVKDTNPIEDVNSLKD